MRVLIVEDEFIVAEDLRLRLETAGHSICAIADSGEKAVELSLREKPDAVIMDVLLQGRMDGVQAAREIARQVNASIILISGLASLECNEFPFFTKPLPDAVIEAWLDDQSDRRKAV